MKLPLDDAPLDPLPFRIPSLARLAATAGLVALSAFWNPASASPILRCEVEQGGKAQVLDFAPVADPYGVRAVDLGGRFRFKAVVIGDGTRVEYVKLYSYYQVEEQWVLLHEAKYIAPAVQPVYGQAGLTGIHYLYSPKLGRELQFSCSLFEAKS